MLNGSDKQLSACLALGPRPDGTVQARDELQALMAITPNLQRAVIAANHVDRKMAREAKDRRSLSRQVAMLSARLAELERRSAGDGRICAGDGCNPC